MHRSNRPIQRTYDTSKVDSIALPLAICVPFEGYSEQAVKQRIEKGLGVLRQARESMLVYFKYKRLRV